MKQFVMAFYAFWSMVAAELEWSPKLGQTVKTQNPLNGELSHGIVA